MAAGGAALAIPSVQVALVTRIPHERQGVAFGLNMSAVPASILLAGIAVPLVGETAGWRWAFGGAGAVGIGLSLAAATSLRNERWTSSAGRREPIHRKPVFLGCGAMFLGLWGGQSVATFAVESGVDAGHNAGSIGYALAVASVVAIAVRIVAGWWADRTGPGRAFPGDPCTHRDRGGGIGLLAVGGSFLVVAAGVVLGLGFGWGWNGVLVYGLVRPNPRAAATTASVMMIGGFGGLGRGSDRLRSAGVWARSRRCLDRRCPRHGGSGRIDDARGPRSETGRSGLTRRVDPATIRLLRTHTNRALLRRGEI